MGRRWESWALADPETTHPYCWNLSSIPAVSPKKRFQNSLVHKILRTKELLNTPGYFQDVLTITSFQPVTPSLPWCQHVSTRLTKGLCIPGSSSLLCKAKPMVEVCMASGIATNQSWDHMGRFIRLLKTCHSKRTSRNTAWLRTDFPAHGL